jgi:hypothetical protein
LRDADFPQYEKRSLQRTEELALRATKVAAAFGEAGIPLVSLAKLVLERAQEVTQ